VSEPACSRWNYFVRCHRVHGVACRFVAAGGFPDHPDLGQLARRQRGDDGDYRRNSARNVFVHRFGRNPDDVEQFVGRTSITMQFDLSRDITSAAQDVEAAIAAASGSLPKAMLPPTYHKTNPAEATILTLALTSDVLPLTELDHYAEDVIRAAALSDVGRWAGRLSRTAASFRAEFG